VFLVTDRRRLLWMLLGRCLNRWASCDMDISRRPVIILNFFMAVESVRNVICCKNTARKKNKKVTIAWTVSADSRRKQVKDANGHRISTLKNFFFTFRIWCDCARLHRNLFVTFWAISTTMIEFKLLHYLILAKGYIEIKINEHNNFRSNILVLYQLRLGLNKLFGLEVAIFQHTSNCRQTTLWKLKLLFLF